MSPCMSGGKRRASMNASSVGSPNRSHAATIRESFGASSSPRSMRDQYACEISIARANSFSEMPADSRALLIHAPKAILASSIVVQRNAQQIVSIEPDTHEGFRHAIGLG